MARLESPLEVQRTFKREKSSIIPSKNTIYRAFKKFCKTGSVIDQAKRQPKKPDETRITATVAAKDNVVLENVSVSLTDTTNTAATNRATNASLFKVRQYFDDEPQPSLKPNLAEEKSQVKKGRVRTVKIDECKIKVAQQLLAENPKISISQLSTKSGLSRASLLKLKQSYTEKIEQPSPYFPIPDPSEQTFRSESTLPSLTTFDYNQATSSPFDFVAYEDFGQVDKVAAVGSMSQNAVYCESNPTVQNLSDIDGAFESAVNSFAHMQPIEPLLQSQIISTSELETQFTHVNSFNDFNSLTHFESGGMSLLSPPALHQDMFQTNLFNEGSKFFTFPDECFY
jgi:hypothetical protein